MDDDLYFDPVPPSRMVNHSCNPNSALYMETLNDRVQIYALRDIATDEQITFDYSTCMDGGETWTLECCCGEPNCRGTILNFTALPKDLQQFYVSKNAVLPFILRHVIAPRVDCQSQ